MHATVNVKFAVEGVRAAHCVDLWIKKIEKRYEPLFGFIMPL
jgi:hypothetical protein